MAIDDVVSGIGTDNAGLTFQPAAGVEVLITSFISALGIIKLTNGTSTSVIVLATNWRLNQLNIKLFVNNTNYMTIDAGGSGKFNSYTGIQTK